jgi:NAD(P)-dependent dehydrogenase (short-subunit alcohol dehydrogenase family)
MRLQDRVAIITGAASGIGAGTAEVFAEQGARLVLVDRDAEGLAATVATLPAPDGFVVPFVGDVADAGTARGAARLAQETFGGLDILFNNAGVMTSGDFREVDETAWDNVLDINLRGMYLMCRAVLPGMLERGHGAIVNTSSVMAFLTEPGYEAYTTSKAGIVGLTKALAVSYATRGIRVNCICPGWVDTPMNRRLADDLGGMDNLTPIILRQQPNGRMITTREIGNAVAFLASDDASGITGTALYIDGGASAAI